jgi:hypothetical protein
MPGKFFANSFVGYMANYSGLTLYLPDCKAESCHCLNAVLGIQAVLLARPQALPDAHMPAYAATDSSLFAGP